MTKEKTKTIPSGLTFEQVKAMIVGSEEKLTLLNVFTGLANENIALKAKVEDLEKPKTKS